MAFAFMMISRKCLDLIYFILQEYLMSSVVENYKYI